LSFSSEKKIRIFVQIAIATCVWGLLTELIQRYFIVNRTFDLMDWLADSVGVTVAFFVSKRRFIGSPKK
jgi:VanZ family protein